MKSQSISLSREERVFRVGEDDYLIFTGVHNGDKRPFLRVGAPPGYAIELTTFIEHLIIPKSKPGNLGLEKQADRFLRRLLREPSFRLKAGQVLTQYGAVPSLGRRIYSLLDMRPEDRLHPQNLFRQREMDAESKPEVESLAYTDGNIQIQLRNSVLFDFEKINRRNYGLARVWKELEKGAATGRKARSRNSGNNEEANPFGEVWGADSIGFIFLGGSPGARLGFQTESNRQAWQNIQAENAKNDPASFDEEKEHYHFVLKFGSELVALNPEHQEHLRLAQLGLDLDQYRTCVSSNPDNSGLFQLLDARHALQRELENNPGAELEETYVYFPQDDGGAQLRQVYPSAKVTLLADERKITKKSPIRFYHNSDNSLSLFHWNQGPEVERQVLFPLASGSLSPRFSSPVRKLDVTILPFLKEGYGDADNTLILHFPPGKGESRYRKKIGGPGIHELVGASKYEILSIQHPSELIRYYRGLTPAEDPLTELVVQFAEALLLEGRVTGHQDVLGQILRQKIPTDPLEQANLAEFWRLLGKAGNLTDDRTEMDARSRKLFQMVANRYSHSLSDDFTRAYHNRRVLYFAKQKEEADATLPVLEEELRPDIGWWNKTRNKVTGLWNRLRGREWELPEPEERTSLDLFQAGSHELTHQIIISPYGSSYLFRRAVERPLPPLALPDQSYDEDQFQALKAHYRKAEKFLENMDRPSSRLKDLLKTFEKLREQSLLIAGERKRLDSFLDKQGLKPALELFDPQPRNWLEEFYWKARDSFQDVNDYLMRFSLFQKIQDGFTRLLGHRLPYNSLLLSLVLFLLLLVGLFSALPGGDSPTRGQTGSNQKNLVKGNAGTGPAGEGTGQSAGQANTASEFNGQQQEILSQPAMKKIKADFADRISKLASESDPELSSDHFLLREIHELARLISMENGYYPPGEKETAGPGKKNPDVIFPGEKLTIPGNGVKTVKSRQTIWAISAQMYGQYFQEIMDKIRAGGGENAGIQKLAVTNGLKKLAAQNGNG